MRVVAAVVGALAVVSLAWAVWHFGIRVPHPLHEALARSPARLDMTEAQLNTLHAILAERGEGTRRETREVLYWLVCSGKITATRLEPAAKAALGLVHIKNASPRDAVMEVLDPQGKTPQLLAACSG